MSLLVVGSVAFDAVETPFGKRDRMLGGSASHFSIAASFFTDIRLVAVVGGDFGADERAVFAQHNVDTTDLEIPLESAKDRRAAFNNVWRVSG